jgi:peptidoglycan-N-acetylglucosamine deacetylase
MGKNSHKAIFFDNGIRWKKLKKTAFFLVFSFIVIAGFVITSLLYSPFEKITPLDRATLDEKINEIQEQDQEIVGEGTFMQLTDIYDEAFVQRLGEGEKRVILTFDDGPDPETTRQILTVLKNEQVPGTFFMTGTQIYKFPEVGHEVLATGSDIGLHTFFHHENTADQELSDATFRRELDFSEKVFAYLYGYKTNIFRIPYVGLEDELSFDALQYLREAQLRGLIVSAPTVDSSDWQTTDAKFITEHSTQSNVRTVVLLLHDFGGERQGTVEALPDIIHFYKSRGYEFLTVSQLAQRYNLEAWKPLTFADQFLVPLAYQIYNVYKVAPGIFDKGFFVGFGVVVIHTSIFVVLSLVQIVRKRKRNKKYALRRLSVSVIVPAFNEEKVIQACIHSILKSSYQNLEVIVTDDGSTDNTILKARQIDDPRVTVIANGHIGKFNALNRAIREARGSIIITIDADTRIFPGAISKIMQQFSLPNVGAVAGYVRVGNKVNALTQLQALEYTLNQGIEKRVMDMGGAVLVVPGAFGAWRKSVIQKLGGFTAHTLAEDFDLTLQIIKKGYTVRFAENAIAYTEAPTSIMQLIKQRFRWNFGNLQVYAKNRKLLGNKKYGATGIVFLPRAVFLQMFLTLTMPLVDIFIIINLLVGARMLTLFFLLFYLLFYMFVAFIAFITLREPIKTIVYIPLLRFGYTQLIYGVFYYALIQALRGKLVIWTKLQHKGELVPVSQEV